MKEEKSPPDKEYDVTLAKEKIEKLLNREDAKYENSYAEEGVKRSLFGVFVENYRFYKQTQHNLDELLRSAFRGSTILSDVDRIILYFNLPFREFLKPN